MCKSQDQRRKKTPHIVFAKRADFLYWLLKKDIGKSRSESEVIKEQKHSFFSFLSHCAPFRTSDIAHVFLDEFCFRFESNLLSQKCMVMPAKEAEVWWRRQVVTFPKFLFRDDKPKSMTMQLCYWAFSMLLSFVSGSGSLTPLLSHHVSC